MNDSWHECFINQASSFAGHSKPMPLTFVGLSCDRSMLSNGFGHTECVRTNPSWMKGRMSFFPLRMIQLSAVSVLSICRHHVGLLFVCCSLSGVVRSCIRYHSHRSQRHNRISLLAHFAFLSFALQVILG